MTPEGGGVNQSQAGDALKFANIEGGNIMVKSDSRSRYLQIVSADHQAAHFQVCPNLGMIPSLKQIKRLDKDRCENLLTCRWRRALRLASAARSTPCRSSDAVMAVISGGCDENWRRKPGISNFPRSSAIKIELSRISPMMVLVKANWPERVRYRQQTLRPRLEPSVQV